MNFSEIKERAASRWRSFETTPRPRILLGAGTCGRAAGAAELVPLIRSSLESKSLEADLYEVGCLGLCYAEPLIEVTHPDGPSVLYSGISTENAEAFCRDCILSDKIRPDMALAVMADEGLDGIPPFVELPMLVGQVRITLRNCGRIDPADIDHYIARGGYQALSKVLQMDRSDVIDEVKQSGLRGRGGAGFPTGLKWEFCAKAQSSHKYLICNADEGDPGAFMDRSVLESDPHSVLEGMCIAAYAIGANRSYIYVRAEYPLAVERLNLGIRKMHEYGLLGDNILGSGFSLDIKLQEGAGAFVCGEETALMASIEGRRGMPRTRPPFPAERGLFGKPTNINNVETLAAVPEIISRGSGWYSQFGTEKSKGTKTFALAGKILRTGLIEVPLGTTLRKIVFDIGGGIPQSKKFKAVQTGGPSGGCLPARLLDSPVDYETLAQAGSIMGSGGMIVMDEDTCIVDIARYFTEFTKQESCGQCAPCRLGTTQMHQILTDISAGRGQPRDIELLQEIAESVKAASLCGLGQTAPNPVLTTIRYFRKEYEDHIKRKKCSAAVCEGLVAAPCEHTCPAGVNASRYVRYIAQRRYSDALNVVLEKLPLPSICGRVCAHPCETKCRRGQIDRPIAIRALKRFVTESVTRPRVSSTRPPTGKSVAVVGSGPAGLTAAYYLQSLGHRVVVFEALSEPGGMLRTGIPAFRLPRKVLNREIAALDLDIRTNYRVKSLEALRRKFDAVFLATGAHKGAMLGVPGERLKGVFDCISLLREVNSGSRVRLGKRVAVIGGGSAAIDCARTAVRTGADQVQLIYRRTRAEMPAAPEEIHEAEREGVELRFLAAPLSISRGSEGLELDCIRMELGPIDSTGRPSPQPIPGSDFTATFDSVIVAIGQLPDIPESFACTTDRRGRLSVDEDNLSAGIDGVFAGGDVVTGPSTVIESVAMGRQAAICIDLYLGGDGNIDQIFAPEEDTSALEVEEPLADKERVRIPVVPVSRRTPKREVEMTLSERAAVTEARRCLHCDLEETTE